MHPRYLRCCLEAKMAGVIHGLGGFREISLVTNGAWRLMRVWSTLSYCWASSDALVLGYQISSEFLISALKASMLIDCNFRYSIVVGWSHYIWMEYASQQQQKSGPKSKQRSKQREHWQKGHGAAGCSKAKGRKSEMLLHLHWSWPYIWTDRHIALAESETIKTINGPAEVSDRAAVNSLYFSPDWCILIPRLG